MEEKDDRERHRRMVLAELVVPWLEAASESTGRTWRTALLLIVATFSISVVTYVPVAAAKGEAARLLTRCGAAATAGSRRTGRAGTSPTQTMAGLHSPWGRPGMAETGR